MTIAALLTDLEQIVILLEVAGHGSLRVVGTRLPDELRPAVIVAKPVLLEALSLRDRLERGWVLCEMARDPTDRYRMEEHWLRLLKEYEALCDWDLQESLRAA